MAPAARPVTLDFLMEELGRFRALFNYTRAEWPHRYPIRVYHSACTYPDRVPVYSRSYVGDIGWPAPTPWNLETMEGATPQLVAAYQKQHHCDIAVETLIDTLNRVFKAVGVDFQACGMLVNRGIILDSLEPCQHTVFRVADQSSRNAYIMDLTIGQYGFPEECFWLLPEHEYEECFLLPESPQFFDVDMDLLELGEDKNWKAIRKTIEKLIPDNYLSLNDREKDLLFQDIQRHVDEVLERIKVEILEDAMSMSD